MNLSDMLKEASIIDHSWYENGLSNIVEEEVEDVADPKPNNIKNELEVQWDNGGPALDLGPDIDVVKRNIPEELDVSSGVIMFARDCMNKGLMGEELVAALQDRFDSTTMSAEAKELKAQLELQGFVGCVAIDGRGYKSCKEAMQAAENSPYKDTIKYVIGCSCGDSVEMPVAGAEITLAETSGNSMDDFIASEDTYEPKMIECCRSTMLPIVSAQSDIDQEHMAPATIDLMNVTGLPEGELAAIQSSDASWTEKVKKTFRAAYKAKKVAAKSAYTGKVDTSEHSLVMADNEIELEAKAQSGVDLDVNVAEITLESTDFKQAEVDMGQELTGIFEGSDEVSVDDVKEANAPLDVDMRADMTI